MKRRELIQRLQELGIQPKRSLGQNFLVNEAVCQKIVAAVLTGEPRQIVEIGPGVGALTDLLMATEIPYLAVELDHHLAEYWRQKGQKVVEVDALSVSWGELVGRHATLVSNLPYQISARLIVELAEQGCPFQQMVLMFQKEVAQRLMAQPYSKDYGLLSVVAQTQWDMKSLCDAGPGSFYPPPKVNSQVVVFETKGTDGNFSDFPGFVGFLKQGFGQRRKILLKRLQAYGKPIPAPEIEATFASLGIAAKSRPEEVSVRQWQELFKNFCSLKERYGN